MPSLKIWRTIARLLLLLVGSCATVPPPVVYQALSADSRIKIVDDASSQPVANRAAGVVIALRRIKDKHDVPLALSSAWEAADVAEQHSADETKRADHNEAWARWGPLGIAAAAVAGVLGGIAVDRALHH